VKQGDAPGRWREYRSLTASMAMAAATCAEQDVVAARGTGLDASALDGGEDPGLGGD
jgi:hypothetical protein